MNQLQLPYDMISKSILGDRNIVLVIVLTFIYIKVYDLSVVPSGPPVDLLYSLDLISIGKLGIEVILN